MKSAAWMGACLGCLLAATAGAAMLVSEVKDQAGLFKPDAVEQANKTIKTIKDAHKKDLVFETYPTIPAGRKEEFDRLGKVRYFEEWARARGQALEVNGLIILVCKEPSHLIVEVGEETRKKAFTLADRDQLVKMLQDRFHKKEFDEGLRDAVAFVAKKLEQNLR